MDFGQKFGAGLLMGIPAFVGAGFWYHVFHHSYVPAIIWMALMPVVWWFLITGKIFSFKEK